MRDPVHVYQIFFDRRQLGELDPQFIPYDNSACPTPDEREFYVFKKEFLAGHIADSGYTGYVSWKFGAKTGISGQRFIDFCAANPGYDVYYVNPYPLEICRGNVWDHGEVIHPGMKKLAQLIFDTAGYNIQLDEIPQSLLGTAYCNFWVGNKTFWEEYMRFCIPLYDAIHHKLSGQDKARLFVRADRITTASYFPYIFERLFSTFILLNPHIRKCPYVFSEVELKAKYPARFADLVNQIQKAEIDNPQDREPIKSNESFRMAGSELTNSSFVVALTSLMYNVYIRLSNRLPFLNSPFMRRLLRRLRLLVWA